MNELERREERKIREKKTLVSFPSWDDLLFSIFCIYTKKILSLFGLYVMENLNISKKRGKKIKDKIINVVYTFLIRL